MKQEIKTTEAIEPVEDGDLFRFHEAPNPECPVGRNVHALLDDKLKRWDSGKTPESILKGAKNGDQRLSELCCS